MFEKESARNAELQKASIGNKWTILKTPTDGPYFVTTDNPGVGVNNGEFLNTNFAAFFTSQLPISIVY